MESLDRLTNLFVKEFSITKQTPFDFYLSFVEGRGYDCENFGNMWTIENTLILNLPIKIQLILIKDYLGVGLDDVNLDFTKSIYYWHNYFSKRSEPENINLILLRDTIKYFIDTHVTKYSLSKYLTLIFLKYRADEIIIRSYFDARQIDNILIGLLFSNNNIWETKKVLDKIIKNKVYFEDSYDILNWIFEKYNSSGIDSRKIFGTIVDVVQIND